MTHTDAVFNRTRGSEIEPGSTQFGASSFIDHLLAKLTLLDLPAKEHFESYLRYKVRSNHKPKTIESSFTSVRLFLTFYGTLGKQDLKDVQRSDLEAFIEHEQDRGMHITTVKTRTACIVAFSTSSSTTPRRRSWILFFGTSSRRIVPIPAGKD